MKYLLQILSLAGILLTIIPSVLFFSGTLSRTSQNLWMLIGTIAWFVTATFWLGKKKEPDKA